MSTRRRATKTQIRKALGDIKCDLVSRIRFPYDHPDAKKIREREDDELRDIGFFDVPIEDMTKEIEDKYTAISRRAQREEEAARKAFVKRCRGEELTGEDKRLIENSEIRIWEGFTDYNGIKRDNFALSVDSDFYSELNYGYAEFGDPYTGHDCRIRHRLAKIGCDWESYDYSIKEIYCEPTTKEERAAEVKEIDTSYCSEYLQ